MRENVDTAGVRAQANWLAYQYVSGEVDGGVDIETMTADMPVRAILRECVLSESALRTITEYLLACAEDPDDITPMEWAKKTRRFVLRELPDLIRAELPDVIRRVREEKERTAEQIAADNYVPGPLAVDGTAYMLIGTIPCEDGEMPTLRIGEEVRITDIQTGPHGVETYHVCRADGTEYPNGFPRGMLWTHGDAPHLDPR